MTYELLHQEQVGLDNAVLFEGLGSCKFIIHNSQLELEPLVWVFADFGFEECSIVVEEFVAEAT